MVDIVMAPTRIEFQILLALFSGPRHGYGIMQDVEDSSHGVVKMGPATLYGTLKRLVELGLTEETDRRPSDDDDQRRRYYHLTALGRRVCIAEADRLESLVRVARTNLGPGLA